MPVDLKLPDGRVRTFDDKDVAQARTAGAVPLTAEEARSDALNQQGGDLTGQLATGALAAGRTATFGLSDFLMSEAVGAVGGDEARKDTLKAFSLAKETNPYADVGGEVAGLLAGGGGITALGERAEAAVASRLGEGLLGRSLSMGARGTAEGALIGAQHQISEDILGDHELNGQAIFAQSLKDGLIGGGVGTFLGGATGLIGRKLRGPIGDAVADELAGAPGAGRAVLEDARQAEQLMVDARAAGATTDQAVKMSEDVATLGKGRLAAAEADAAMVPGRVSLESLDTGIRDAVEGADPLRLGAAQGAEIKPGYMRHPDWLVGGEEAPIAIGKGGVVLDTGGVSKVAGEDVLRAGGRDLSGPRPLSQGSQAGHLPRRIELDEGLMGDPTARAVHDPYGLGLDLGPAPKAALEGLPSPIRIGRPTPGATLESPIASETIGVAGKQKSGPLTGLFDSMVGDQYAARAGARSPELKETLKKGYEYHSGKLIEMRQAVDDSALELKRATDRMLKVERVMDEASFTQRPERMAKFIDRTLVDAQRDAGALIRQETEGLLAEINATAMRGGTDQLSFNRVGKQLIDSVNGATTPEGMFIGLNRLKQQVGKASGFGVPPHLRTAPQNAMGELYTSIQRTLEDGSVWGEKAAQSQKAVNEAFSTDFRRSTDFGNRFTVGLDEAKGVPLPEADAEKLKNGLLKKLGSEADSQQAIKSTETWVERNRSRMAALREHGDLTPQQLKVLAEGEAALKDFQGTFGKSREQALAVAKIEQQMEREAGKGMGGLLGLVTDAATKPMTTMRRLADIRATVARVEEGVGKLLKGFGQGGEKAAEAAAPRGKDVVAGEIAKIRELQGNPQMLESRLAAMTGDLSGVAPRVAEEVKNTARRAIYWLDKEAPTTAARVAVMGMDHRPQRYSDKQISDWETKREAALGAVNGSTAPEKIIADMGTGRLNREAIRTMEFVSPKLFAKVQEMAQYELERQRLDGRLDKMPYQQKAAISVLLKVPADGTWTPQFIDAIQAVKMLPPPASVPSPGAPQGAPANGTSKRKIEFNPDVFMTASAGIEQGGSA